MRDIKVIDTLKEVDYIEKARLSFPVGFFAEAVAFTRKEPGVPIEDIGKCFRAQFDESELVALIKELNKGKL